MIMEKWEITYLGEVGVIKRMITIKRRSLLGYSIIKEGINPDNVVKMALREEMLDEDDRDLIEEIRREMGRVFSKQS